MGSKVVQLLLRATPPSSPLFSFRKSDFPVQNKRFYVAKSSLEPPNVERLADTARISLTPQQVLFAFRTLFLFALFGQLQAVDLQSIEPAIRAGTEGDNLRNDVPEIFDNRDAMIASVPSYEDSYIKVPKVLHKE
ncbi:hypothetical protein RD792_008540 [Penstemon davidsonii]|uniref:Glutamyl-tRNA(Gln) amidotransferase subunit C, chloroplastic/mitochondrial n=1 Tax=Penstemon davidsonii TaxID=160366 RepID=A0ABR0D9E6_9LAMI|nr:hypothetical protein RD792_008540 [Penstemon davidsonii]